jgi:Transglycosylase
MPALLRAGSQGFASMPVPAVGWSGAPGSRELQPTGRSAAMIAPSPAPKPPRRLVWPWVLVALLLTLAALIGLAWWLVPPWLERLASESLTTRLQQKLEHPVLVGRVELDLPRVRVYGVAIGDPQQPLVWIEEVDVVLDEQALWSGRVEPTDARVRGGAVTGERGELEALVARLAERSMEREPLRRGRVRLVPVHLSIRDLQLDVWQGAREHPAHRVEGRLAMNATPADGRASVTLEALRLSDRSIPAIRATSIRSELVLERNTAGRSLRFPLALELQGVGTQLTPQIAVAGVDGRVIVADASLSEIAVALEGGFSDRDDGGDTEHLWSVKGRVRRDLTEGALDISMEAFELGKVPEILARLPLVESEAATVGGRVALAFGSGLARAEGQVRIDGLNIAHPVLARDTVRDVGFDLGFAVEIDPQKPGVVLHHAHVARRGVELRLEGELLHPAERNDRRYRLHAEVPPTPCQRVLEAIPSALVPSLQGFVLGGSFELAVDMDVDFADLAGLVLDGNVGLAGCRVDERPARAAAERLAGGFTHRVTMRDGQIRAVRLYPGSGTFTPLPLISPYMVQAVLTTEDGGFWRHDGFLPSQFRTALLANLEAGKVRLGASTITMQMVKNVLLSHERTLARKLQEMILTWYVEAALTKERIMEIYLNVVELGPGIYGVTRAAEHYFGKHPSELTPPEAAYLALMLPSPVRRHANYCRGEPSPAFQIKLARILRIMNERKRLSDLDYAAWKDVGIVFDLRERGDTGACLGEIEALMAADEGQRALSGLLAEPEDTFFGGDDGSLGQESVLSSGLDDDPSAADAPGTPAMDEILGEPE